MKVDIVIPTHNPNAYIFEAIDSCLAQSYKNITINIVDDASENKIDFVKKKYPKLNYLRLEQNSGPAAARNFGIKNTSGDLVSFLDDDDIMNQDKIFYSVEEFKQNKDIGMTCGNYQIFANGRLMKPFYPMSIKVNHQSLMKINLVASGSTTVRRDVLKEIGGFNEKYWIGEDYATWLHISELYPIKYIHKVLYFYRIVRGSNRLTQREDIQKNHLSNIEEIKKDSMERINARTKGL
jgi:glycosyltransferase involved in cell wall biosynthesis